eukprot:gnl/TRDRNA2_/TRDRNA2_84278_c0_seq2.p1 gnl/TRDRNA2_/TRDRNA2_84278_c0~~gnl/TRDRNA2_/TRDRNA2_84278_c0_seq2.p1  ORF type:complete len:453 (+),score=86.82 gnl/TRDRNA2_/TRDRNA2_84278_c0_seq2:67-1359(+)
MGPKKVEEAADDAAEEDAPAEEPETEIFKKCFRLGGKVYYGDCKTSKPPGSFVRHGFGRQVSTATTVAGDSVIMGTYEGMWEDDVMVGHGTYRWPDGSYYEGNFVGGELHGFGRFEWPEGSAYEGTWHKGQMSGQGRFDSRFDGSFLQGRYHRDCFQSGEKWLNVCIQHRKWEQYKIKEGDASSVQVLRCSEPDSLAAILDNIHADGLLPFLVAPVSASQGPIALDWIRGRSEDSTVSVSEAATAKRRQRDSHRYFFDAIQAALLNNEWFTIVLEDTPDAAGQPMAADNPLSDATRLSNFFEPFSFPLEVFHPKLFNGRGRSTLFLPDELIAKYTQAEAPPTADAEQEAEEGEAAEPTPAVPAPSMPSEEMPVYCLRAAVAVLARIPDDLGTSEVRERIVKRYGGHVPMHRCSIVLLGHSSPPRSPMPGM